MRHPSPSPGILLLDSITETEPADAGQVAVSGSHGGRTVARYATRYPLRGVFFNDAGFGKDDAGVAALAVLDDAGMAAASYAHSSARIGEAVDAWNGGVLSRVNASAARAGLAVGMTVQQAAARLVSASVGEA